MNKILFAECSLLLFMVNIFETSLNSCYREFMSSFKIELETIYSSLVYLNRIVNKISKALLCSLKSMAPIQDGSSLWSLLVLLQRYFYYIEFRFFQVNWPVVWVFSPQFPLNRNVTDCFYSIAIAANAIDKAGSIWEEMQVERSFNLCCTIFAQNETKNFLRWHFS